jgi:hypothetical protein
MQRGPFVSMISTDKASNGKISRKKTGSEAASVKHALRRGFEQQQQQQQ